MGLLNKCAGCVAFLAVFIGVIVPTLLSHVNGGWTRKYTTPGFKTEDIPSLKGKVVLVTGANAGIGLESAKELARKGAQVYATSRSSSKGKAAIAEINAAISSDSSHVDVELMPLDLASFKSIKAFGEAWTALDKPIDILLLNAGVMKSPGMSFVHQKFTYGYEVTADGFENHIGVNHIGHFYLTQLMKPFLKKGARVIAVSSAAEENAYDAGIRFDLWREKTDEYEDGNAYGMSKLANIMFAREIAERWRDDGIEAYSCHPGVIMTELSRYLTKEMEDQTRKDGGAVGEAVAGVVQGIFQNSLFSRADGALTQLHLAVASGLKNGGYYVPIASLSEPIHPQGGNLTLQKLLWEKSEEAIEKTLANMS